MRNSTFCTVSGAVAPEVPASVAGLPKAWRAGAAAGVTIEIEGLDESKLNVIGAAGISMLPFTVPTALSSENTSSE